MEKQVLFPNKQILLLLMVWYMMLWLCNPQRSYAKPKEEIQTIRNGLKSVPENSTQRVEYLIGYGRYCLEKTGELQIDLDSALTFQGKALALAKQLSYNSGIADAMILEGRIYQEMQLRNKAIIQLKKAFIYAQKQRLYAQQGDFFVHFSQFQNNDSDGLGIKIGYYIKAIQLYHKANAKEDEATSRKMLGDYYSILGKSNEAIEQLELALKIYQEIQFKDLQGVYNILSGVYTQMGNYELAIKYGLQAVRTAESLGDESLQLSSIYNKLGLSYLYLGQYQRALESWQKAATIAEKYKEADYLRIIYDNIVNAYASLHEYTLLKKQLAYIEKNYPPNDYHTRLMLQYRYVMLYLDLKQYDKAKPNFAKLLELNKDTSKDIINQMYINHVAIRYYIETKQSDKAYLFLIDQDKISRSVANKKMLYENYLTWFKADSALGNLSEAIKHYKLYKLYSDSVMNAQKAKQISNLQIQFDTEKKDKNILLLTQKSELQNATIRNDRIIKTIAISGTIVLILLLLLGYNRYQLKQQTNLQLEQKQKEINQQNDLLKRLLNEKEWLIREIHHRVKNNLQIVISLLNTQSAHLQNLDALEAIQDSQHRMHVISLIHQKLYQTENLATIDMEWYIRELVSHTKECFMLDKKLSFDLLTEPITLDVAQAVPLGLILNEAISNAVKYAFPNQQGQVKIVFKTVSEKCGTLAISDNGVGLPDDFNVAESDSLGMSLMRGLSEQIEGTFDVQNQNGLTITVVFPIKTELEHSIIYN